jgi:hypothetical protein
MLKTCVVMFSTLLFLSLSSCSVELDIEGTPINPPNGTYTLKPRIQSSISGRVGGDYLVKIVNNDYHTVIYITNTPSGDGTGTPSFVLPKSIINDLSSSKRYVAVAYDDVSNPPSVTFVRLRTNHFRLIDGAGTRLFAEIKLTLPDS